MKRDIRETYRLSQKLEIIFIREIGYIRGEKNSPWKSLLFFVYKKTYKDF